jgi:hypothetical protein
MKKRIALLGALAVAGGLLYALESQRKRNKSASAQGESGGQARGSEREHAIDDQGTSQAQASQILTHIRDSAFEASDEKLALALGRPTEEIEDWTRGNGLIDGDVIFKARALAIQRGFEI